MLKLSWCAFALVAVSGCIDPDTTSISTATYAVEGFAISNADDVNRLGALLDDLGKTVASTAYEAKAAALDYEQADNAYQQLKSKLLREGADYLAGDLGCNAELRSRWQRAFDLYHNHWTPKLIQANYAAADYHEAAEKIAKALASVSDDGLRATAQTRFASIALQHGAKTAGAWSRVTVSRVANLGAKTLFGALYVGACAAGGAVADVLLNPNVCQGGERPNPTDERCESWVKEYQDLKYQAIQRYGMDLNPPPFANQQDGYSELMRQLALAEEKYNTCQSDSVGPFSDQSTYEPEDLEQCQPSMFDGYHE